MPLLILLLLITPAQATPTEEDYCAFIVPELTQAVHTGTIDQSEADSILNRCHSLNEET